VDSCGSVTETWAPYILVFICGYVRYHLHSMEQVVAELFYDSVNVYTSLSITAYMCKQ
jgi:hypothetical protein